MEKKSESVCNFSYLKICGVSFMFDSRHTRLYYILSHDLSHVSFIKQFQKGLTKKKSRYVKLSHFT